MNNLLSGSVFIFFFFKQKTAYEMRISDWSSDVCSSDLPGARMGGAEMSPIWYATAFTTGVLITLGASWLPTRKATRVSPLAALRPDTGIDARTASGRLQLFLGIALVASGIAGLAAAIGSSSVPLRSEEHTSELQSLMRISYAVFCLKKK